MQLKKLICFSKKPAGLEVSTWHLKPYASFTTYISIICVYINKYRYRQYDTSQFAVRHFRCFKIESWNATTTLHWKNKTRTAFTRLKQWSSSTFSWEYWGKITSRSLFKRLRRVNNQRNIQSRSLFAAMFLPLFWVLFWGSWWSKFVGIRGAPRLTEACPRLDLRRKAKSNYEFGGEPHLPHIMFTEPHKGSDGHFHVISYLQS